MSWAGPPWLVIAQKEIGVQEVIGSGNNPRILEYHAATDLKAVTDRTPWCGSFLAWCVKGGGGKVPMGAAGARSWLKLKNKLAKPELGCVVILRRGYGSASGHVGFYVGDDVGHIKLLSGNYMNMVCVASFPKSRVLGYRWPQ